jgi:intermediate cleaving peptidase 55
MHQIHNSACTLLREELKQIGLDVRANDLEQVLFPHYVSHPIGLGKPEALSVALRYSSLM